MIHKVQQLLSPVTRIPDLFTMHLKWLSKSSAGTQQLRCWSFISLWWLFEHPSIFNLFVFFINTLALSPRGILSSLYCSTFPILSSQHSLSWECVTVPACFHDRAGIQTCISQILVQYSNNYITLLSVFLFLTPTTGLKVTSTLSRTFEFSL